MEGDSVTLIGFWGSPFALRVKWALGLKGVQYQSVEEDLSNKSAMLLQYNPVYKKVPVLVHEGKPLAESLVILEYIDETWKHNPLLPLDPYKRAKARFWSRFVDEKIRIETDPADRTQLRMTVASGDPTLTFELKEFIKEQLVSIPAASRVPTQAGPTPPMAQPASAPAALNDPGAMLAALL